MNKRYLRTVFRHMIVWFFAFILWTLFREFGQEIIREEGEPTISLAQRVPFHIVLGVFAGLIFGTLEFYFDKFIYKKISFGRSILVGAISYLVAIILLVTFGIRAFTRIVGVELDWQIFPGYVFSGEMIMLIVYCFIVGFFIDLFREIDKKFGPGNLWKMLKGEFYHPKEEQRIFMFLDLKNSTGLAEELGHSRYSQLIQDCFKDVSEMVLRYKASIYQYVGDEIVLTWTIREGLDNLNCIQFYFAYKRKLQAKANFYEAKYGVIPTFKAGLEMGPVMVAEVGDLKREIAYHGDVLNTAARIQACCNTYGKNLLISENLEESFRDALQDKTELLGDIQLRGKQKNVKVYSVDAV